LKKIKIIWIISLIIVVLTSLGVSLYFYNTPSDDEKIIIDWAQERNKYLKYKDSFKIISVKINKESDYCIIQYSFEDEQGKDHTFKEVWELHDNKIDTNIGNLYNTEATDLSVGYLDYTSDLLKEIATEVENDKHTLSFNSARITRFINE
jgi:flagellar basal body-associated protein FliL